MRGDKKERVGLVPASATRSRDGVSHFDDDQK
jgi:hypothetical protein